MAFRPINTVTQEKEVETKSSFKPISVEKKSVEPLVGGIPERIETPIGGFNVPGGGFGGVPKSEYESGQRNLMGNLFERPAAAIREGIRGAISGEDPAKAFARAAINPSTSETFQEEFTRRAQKLGGESESVAVNFLKGYYPAVAGFTADVITNPADALLTLVTEGGSKVIQNSSKFKPLLKFLTKKRAGGLNTERGLLKGAELADSAINVERSKINRKIGSEVAKIPEVRSVRIANFIDEYAKQFPEGINVAKYKKISSRLKDIENGKVRGTEIKNIQNELSKTINWKIRKFDPQQKARADVWFSIQDELTKLNPNLKPLNEELKEFSKVSDDVYSVILENGRAGTKQLRKKVASKLFTFDDLTVREKDALKTLNKMSDPEQQFLQYIDGYRNMQRLKGVGAGVAGLVGAGIARESFGNKSPVEYIGGE